MTGGGFIGSTGNRNVLAMVGSVDTYWTKDAVYWEKINFVEGGGNSPKELYSSNEWSRTTIDGTIVFLGVWGHKLINFNDGTEKVYMLILYILHVL
jgi:hypothetical protein